MRAHSEVHLNLNFSCVVIPRCNVDTSFVPGPAAASPLVVAALSTNLGTKSDNIVNTLNTAANLPINLHQKMNRTSALCGVLDTHSPTHCLFANQKKPSRSRQQSPDTKRRRRRIQLNSTHDVDDGPEDIFEIISHHITLQTVPYQYVGHRDTSAWGASF